MQEITSVQNPIVKLVNSLHQKKNRQELGLFIIEGYKGVKDAMSYGIELTHIFLKKDKATRSEIIEEFPEELLYLVNNKVLSKITTTDTPCNILAVAKQFKYEVKHLLDGGNPLIIVLDDVKDPGNLGTVIRTAKAANASGIILTGDTADIFNPKTVRSSAGNLWKIPLVSIENRRELRKVLKKYGEFQFIGTQMSDKAKSCYEVDYKPSTVIMLGSEAEGLSDELADQADFSVKIPMNSEVESLNLSISAGVLLYEVLRQREKD